MTSPRRKSPASAARALEKRVGVDRLAERLDVTARTVKRWLRDGVPSSRKDDVRAAWTRSERSRVTAEKTWARKHVAESRDEIFKSHRLVDHREHPITAESPGGHTTLVALIREEDPAWQEFVRAAEEHGLDPRSEWFSPKVKKKSKKGKKKKKKPVMKRMPPRKNRIGKRKPRGRKRKK